MGLDFRLRDFAYPFALLRYRRQFDRQQYFPAEALAEYQRAKFTSVVRHAYENVPYYRALFDAHAIEPRRITELTDSSQIPFLTKADLSRSFADLVAADVRKYKPVELHTSGTTGGQVRFLVDRTSNVLEFTYYWRFWGWHGYRIGDRFAEFSAERFTPIEMYRDKLFELSPLTNRLLVNSLLLSKAKASDYVALFRKYKPKFLKGLPSNLYVFALLCSEARNHGIRFRAVFSQGENLLPQQRRLIEQVFSSPVFDSYGHMERTVAISQCPEGSYHIHSDYGFAEFTKPAQELSLPFQLAPGQSVVEVVGTSLHNLSMPLIRYKTGDWVIIDSSQTRCSCNRALPLVRSIIGRDADVVITPDKRAVTALYVALDRLPGLVGAQICQESLDSLVVRVGNQRRITPELGNSIEASVHAFTGPSMRIVIRPCKLEDLYSGGAKFKSIVSHVDPLTLQAR